MFPSTYQDCQIIPPTDDLNLTKTAFEKHVQRPKHNDGMISESKQHKLNS